MASAYDRLPLNALRVFEAVATRLSFSAAAEDLHVTPAAVSQHIRSLEGYLQVRLLVRSGRRVTLTSEGLELLPGVRRGLGELSASLQQLKQHRRAGPLQVTALSSFLQRWILPRMRSYRRRCPNVMLRFHTSSDPVDFSRSPIHVAIRMGRGHYPNLHSEKLLDEWLVPVASPELLRQHGPLRRGARLDAYPLLQASDEPWAASIDDSVGVLAAAEEGLGYALTRWSLVLQSLQKGRLRLAADDFRPYEYSYFFVCPPAYLALPKVTGFRDWIVQEASSFPSPTQWLANRR
jgi:LysR family glycine cleavage system transcriptional activator